MKNLPINISNQLNNMIENGIFKLNEKLPSETEMAKKFNVSRETYRAAIKILEKQGKILTRHGIGTFVVPPLPNIENKIDELCSIGKMITNAGFKEDERQETIEVISCPKEVFEALKIEEGAKVVKLQRYRIANKEAVAYSINYMPYSLVNDAFDNNAFHGSLFAFLREKCNLKIVCADTEFLIPEKNDEALKKINSSGKAKIILLKQLHYSSTNEPVLYSYDYLKNDIFKFKIRRVIK